MILLLSMELFLYAFGKFYILKSPASYLLYDENISISQNKIEEYFSRRDTMLGWPPPDFINTPRFDQSGARPSPAFPETGTARVSLYGNSFTYGTDVDDENAWGNVLSKYLGYRVANYGVSGYGPDQAYLRFKKNIGDESDTIILGFAGTDINRIVNQDRRLIAHQYGGFRIRMKPRFILTSDNKLSHIPIPFITRENYSDYIKHPRKYLKHEWSLPGSNDGGVVFEFPFTVSVGRAILKKKLRNYLSGKPSWIDLFDEDHESNALPLLVKIFQAFDKTVTERGKRPLIIIIPSITHLKYQLANNQSPVYSLLERLTEEKISYLDLTNKILKQMKNRDLCEIFAYKRMIGGCGGHYNREGNKIITEIIIEHLETLHNF